MHSEKSYFCLLIFLCVFTTTCTWGCSVCALKIIKSTFHPHFAVPLAPPLIRGDYIPRNPKNSYWMYTMRRQPGRLSVSLKDERQLQSTLDLFNTPTLSDDEANAVQNLNDRIKEWMLDAIIWYKQSLSPMLPPRCRFLPTCSSYGLEAIRTYGPWKGGILTAWRIFRCNPLGGSGFDPPQWPPPGYFAGSNTWGKK